MLAIILSIIALLLSSISIYLQFFHKRTAINGRLLEIGNNDHNKKETTAYTYSISNVGNQQILISNISFFAGTSSLGRAKASYTVLKYECNDYPTIIRPDEMKLIRISLDKNQFYPKDKLPIRYFVMFEFVYLNGKRKELLHDITSPKDYAWEPFSLKKAIDF